MTTPARKKLVISVATVLGGSCGMGSLAFSPQNNVPHNSKTINGYWSDVSIDVPAPYPADVGKFCDAMLCSFDDYEEIVYKLQHQREALIRRTQMIDNFLDNLQCTLEEDRLGTDPTEIPQLAARARTIFQVEVSRCRLLVWSLPCPCF
jgi:hypothetical protein